MSQSTACPAWQYTLSLLSALQSPLHADEEHHGIPARQAIRRSTDTTPLPAHASVEVIERRSATSVTICWSDPTSCHYVEQIWTLRLARNRTVCVLSGMPIRRGDPVYCPSQRGHVPANVGRTILAAAIGPGEGFVRSRGKRDAYGEQDCL